MYHAIIFSGISQSRALYLRPIGSYRIRTVLEENGYPTKVIDYYQFLIEEQIEDYLDKYVSKETKWIGISGTFFMFPQHWRPKFWFRMKKKFPHVKIVIGGTTQWINREIPYADYVINGYGDHAVIALADYLSGKSVDLKSFEKDGTTYIDGNRDYDVKDLSNIKTLWKEEDCIDKRMVLPIEIARGCVFRCSFCAFPMNGKKKFDYIRAKESLEEEFIRNYEQFGVTSYGFMDDTLNDSEHKVEMLHDVITNLPFKIRFDAYVKPELLYRWPDTVDMLVECGLRGATLGIESTNPSTRAKIAKGFDLDKCMEVVTKLKKASNRKVKTQCNFIVGLPGESEKSIMNTREMVLQNNDIDSWSWYSLSIQDTNKVYYASEIDKDPEKYGYRVSRDAAGYNGRPLVFWVNDQMSYKRAKEIAENLTREDNPRTKIAGWWCGGVESLGVNIDEHYLKHQGLVDNLPQYELKDVYNKYMNAYLEHNLGDNYKKLGISDLALGLRYTMGGPDPRKAEA